MALIYNQAWNLKNYRYVWDVSRNWNLSRLDDPDVLYMLSRSLTQLVAEGLTGLDLLTT